MSFQGPDDVLTNRRYNLNCKVKFFEKNVREDIGGGKISAYHRRMVFLVPQESDECYRFFQAWLPETAQEHFEIACQIGSPVNSPCRVAIKRGHDGQLDKPYLIVMSVGVEEVIKSLCYEGHSLRVTTLPASEDQEADLARDASEGNFQVVE